MTFPYDAVDLFSGAGGWAEGARTLDLDTFGVELDKQAARTATAAGHRVLRGDVTLAPPSAFAGIPGLVASPPCQAWSVAGPQRGAADRDACLTLVDRMADGDDSTDWTEWADPRSPLAAQPMRWVRQFRPRWVALEEVRAVMPLWDKIADRLRDLGYSTWTGVLNAADYGVPQTRRRAVLVASLDRTVDRPTPTHEGRWVTMADALGPAGLPDWAHHRPATTVVASFRPDVIAAPGWRTTIPRQHAPNSVTVTPEQAGVLQGFPANYPWQGAKTTRFRQIGNAIPPPLAAAAIRACAPCGGSR